MSGYPGKVEVERIITELQAKMLLRDWEVVVYEEESEDDDDLMYTNVIRRRNRANISIYNAKEQTCKEWYHGIVHEMMHIPVNQIAEYVYFAILPHVPKSQQDKVYEGFKEIIESVVDRLACAYRNAEGKNPDGSKIGSD